MSTVKLRRDRLDRVLTEIQEHPNHFDWNSWGTNLTIHHLRDDDNVGTAIGVDGGVCGTQACIAGWAAALAQAEGYTACAYHEGWVDWHGNSRPRRLDVMTTARRWLGLTEELTEELFHAEGYFFADHPTRPIIIDDDNTVEDVVAAINEWADANS